VASGEIDTVLTCIVDMQGRLMGKRFHVQNFVESALTRKPIAAIICWQRTWRCTPWRATPPPAGGGYGDYVMKPDLSTMRPVPWLEGTAW
jgi:glutamine synthetase